MIKEITTITVIIFLCALGGVLLYKPINIDTSSKPEPKLEEEFDIKFGQTVSIKGENLKITFAKVLKDNRCPVDINCFQPGKILAEFDLAKNEKNIGTMTFDSIEPYEDGFQQIGEYGIRVMYIKPYRQTGKEIKESDYVATLFIKKLSTKLIKTSIPQGDLFIDQRSPEEACGSELSNIQNTNKGKTCKLILGKRIDFNNTNKIETEKECIGEAGMGGCFSCTFYCE